jgi:hypothetical protein
VGSGRAGRDCGGVETGQVMSGVGPEELHLQRGSLAVSSPSSSSAPLRWLPVRLAVVHCMGGHASVLYKVRFVLLSLLSGMSQSPHVSYSVQQRVL